jgi:type I restriction enzyme S subunit
MSALFTKENIRTWSSGSAQPVLNLGRINSLEIGVPPLAEQHRIVAKVDELMALCDQLKASLATAQTTQLNLADSLVEQAIG